jgi:hypothetical protein
MQSYSPAPQHLIGNGEGECNPSRVHALERLDAVAGACLVVGEDAKNELRLEYLALIGEFLLEQGRGTAVLAPLLDIHEALEEVYRRQRGQKTESERRQSMQIASPWVMARVCAVIDILMASGVSADHAAQAVSRQLMASKLSLPEEGGDSRGWKRVQIWHHRLTTIGRAHPQFEAAQRFKDELFGKHGATTAALALNHPLWDRRARV